MINKGGTAELFGPLCRDEEARRFFVGRKSLSKHKKGEKEKWQRTKN